MATSAKLKPTSIRLARPTKKAFTWSLPIWLHLTLFVLISGAVVYLFLRRAAIVPQGEWDAWAIWNVRARMLYAGSPFTFDRRYFPDSHLEYPILLPLLVAGGWRLVGGFTPAVPILIHGLVLVGILILLRRWLWAVALVGLVAAHYAATQYADLPLALTLLAACAAYVSKREILVGVALGLAALTKNEGALMLVCFFAVWVVTARRVPIKALIALAPFLIALWLFKRYVNIPNDIMGTKGGFQRLLQPDRYQFIFEYIRAHTLDFGTSALPILLAIIIIRGKRILLSVPLLTVLLVFAGYIFIYAISPHDLSWHMATSYDRLLMQLFPALVFALALTSDDLKPRAATSATSLDVSGQMIE